MGLDAMVYNMIFCIYSRCSLSVIIFLKDFSSL